MNREYLVLIESEVERRDAWITKNEAKMTAPPAGDVQDLEGFLQLKEAHDVRIDPAIMFKSNRGLLKTELY